jgi:hypothetical protein
MKINLIILSLILSLCLINAYTETILLEKDILTSLTYPISSISSMYIHNDTTISPDEPGGNTSVNFTVGIVYGDGTYQL